MKHLFVKAAGAGSALMVSMAVCAKDPTPINMIYFTGSSEAVQVGVMVEEGLFEKHGLKPSFANATSGPAITSALASGSVHFGPGYPGLYLPALKQKRDLTVAAPFAESSFYSIIAQPTAAVTDPGQGLTAQAKANVKLMEGKTVGVTALGAQTQIFVQLLARQAGIDPNRITFIPTGGAASAIAAFKNKQIDFLVTWIPEDGMFKAAGVQYKTLVNVNTGPDNTFGNLINGLWLGNGEFMRKNPDVAMAFCRATVEARTFIQNPKNKEAVLKVMQKYQSLTRDGAELIYDTRRYVYEPRESTFVSEALWKSQSQYLTGTPNEGFSPAYAQYVNAPCMQLGRSAIR